MLVDAVGIVAGLAATTCCGWAGHRLGRDRGRWLTRLSLALVAWTVGQAGWTLHRLGEASAQGPMVGGASYLTLTDAGQLAMPVLALAALAAVPTTRVRGLRPGADLVPTEVTGLAGVATDGPQTRNTVIVRGAPLAPAHCGSAPPVFSAPPVPPVPPVLSLPTAATAVAAVAAPSRPRAPGPAATLDGVILGGSLFLLTWSGGWAGTARTDPARTPHAVDQVFTAAHPLGVLLLIFALLCAAGFRQAGDSPAVVLAGAGLAILALTGVWITQPAAGGDRVIAVGGGSVFGALLIVLAALRAGRRKGRRVRRRVPDLAVPPDWLRQAIPYLPVAALTALLLGEARGGIVLDPVEITVGATLAAAIIARHLVTLRTSQWWASRLGAAENEARHWARHDPLTDLANRTLFHERLICALAESRRDGRDVAVLCCDLDDFRVINDSLGHAAGDHLLRAVGQRLRHCVRVSDTVARLGSDEFAVLLDGGPEMPETVGERVLAALRQPVSVGGHAWPVRGSVGLVVARRNQETAEALLRRADTAVHTAKRTGKNRLVVHRPGLSSPATGAHLADALATALRRGARSAGFDVHYQPIVRLRDRKPVALEALARWTAPGKGPVPPGTFVAAAEDGGMVGVLDEMVLTQACAEVAMAYPGCALRLHVNVSASRVADTTLLDSVARALAASRFDPRRLVVEITETARIDDLQAAREVLDEVRALGVAVALDDVGAGHTTLAALHQLPVDVVKLDRTLLEAPMEGSRVATMRRSMMRRSMISLAHALGAVVVAEGIESEGQIAELEELGCELGQGYLFARPVPLSSLTIRQWTPPPVPTADRSDRSAWSDPVDPIDQIDPADPARPIDRA